MAKMKVVLEYLDKSYDMDDVLKKIKEDWISRGNKVKDMDSARVYVKPEECMIYYVIDEVTYSLSL